MGAHSLATQIEDLDKLVSVKKGNLFLSSALSIKLIRTLFLDTTRGLAAPKTLVALTAISTAPQNNFLE